MEVDSSVNHVVAKRLWNMLRFAIFMLRKGGVLKRKMMLDMHLMMKRGKVFGKSLGNLVFHHSARRPLHGFGLKEYEFSCSNSPANPVFVHMAKRRHHSYFPSIPKFPCIQPHPVDEDQDESNAIVISQAPDYNAEFFSKNNLDLSDFPALDESRPLSPFARSNFSVCEEEDQVDRQAEEFISKFYQQIRLQRQISMVQYDEMLARGAR
eukprot:Gb_29515 [translate_table: standard]